jgi:hypothetical protein
MAQGLRCQDVSDAASHAGMERDPSCAFRRAPSAR